MLESLVIRNFQSHQKLKIKFDPGITTIVGPSDAGKSAVIRSIKWVCTNRPAGDAFIKYGQKAVSVKLKVDGRTIVRRKGKANAYELDDQVFVAFGNDVPEPIKNTLNMSPLNFQGQHDSPFWFSETASQVGRELNQIVDLSIIDTAVTNITKQVRETRARIDSLFKLKTEHEADVDRLKWADDAVRDYNELADLQDRYNDVKHKLALLDGYINNLRQYRERLAVLEGAEVCLCDAVLAGERANSTSKRAGVLEISIDKIRQCKKAVDVELPDLVAIHDIVHTHQLTVERREALLDQLESINSVRSTVAEVDEMYTAAHAELEEASEGKCPVCQSPMS